MNNFDNFDLDLSMSRGYGARSSEDESNATACVSGGSAGAPSLFCWTDSFETIVCSIVETCDCD